MGGINRRGFLAATAGTATCLSGLGKPSRAAVASSSAPPQVPLGQTGITLSRVGQGTGMSGGNRQSNHNTPDVADDVDCAAPQGNRGTDRDRPHLLAGKP
jgi:hypothetical protein